MDNYKFDLRRGVLARRGIRDKSLLEDRNLVYQIDDGITRLAPLHLSEKQIDVLFQLLDCEDDWGKIWDTYDEGRSDGDRTDLNSVQRTSRRAKANLLKHARTAAEFKFLDALGSVD